MRVAQHVLWWTGIIGFLTITPGATAAQGAGTVTITEPVNNATVFGNAVIFRADATSSVGVAGVTFHLDGAAVGTEIATPPYQFSWNSTSVSDGRHQITAVARTTSGTLIDAAPVDITVANAAPMPSPPRGLQIR